MVTFLSAAEAALITSGWLLLSVQSSDASMIDFFFCLGEGWMTLSGVGVLLFPLLTVDDEDVLRFLVGPEILYTEIRIEKPAL